MPETSCRPNAGLLWRPKKVAEYLDISERAAHNLMENNEITSIYLQCSNTPRTTQEAVDDWLDTKFLLKKKKR